MGGDIMSRSVQFGMAAAAAVLHEIEAVGVMAAYKSPTGWEGAR